MPCASSSSSSVPLNPTMYSNIHDSSTFPPLKEEMDLEAQVTCETAETVPSSAPMELSETATQLDASAVVSSTPMELSVTVPLSNTDLIVGLAHVEQSATLPQADVDIVVGSVAMELSPSSPPSEAGSTVHEASLESSQPTYPPSDTFNLNISDGSIQNFFPPPKPQDMKENLDDAQTNALLQNILADLRVLAHETGLPIVDVLNRINDMEGDSSSGFTIVHRNGAGSNKRRVTSFEDPRGWTSSSPLPTLPSPPAARLEVVNANPKLAKTPKTQYPIAQSNLAVTRKTKASNPDTSTQQLMSEPQSTREEKAADKLPLMNGGSPNARMKTTSPPPAGQTSRPDYKKNREEATTIIITGDNCPGSLAEKCIQANLTEKKWFLLIRDMCIEMEKCNTLPGASIRTEPTFTPRSAKLQKFDNSNGKECLRLHFPSSDIKENFDKVFLPTILDQLGVMEESPALRTKVFSLKEVNDKKLEEALQCIPDVAAALITDLLDADGVGGKKIVKIVQKKVNSSPSPHFEIFLQFVKKRDFANAYDRSTNTIPVWLHESAFFFHPMKNTYKMDYLQCFRTNELSCSDKSM